MVKYCLSVFSLDHDRPSDESKTKLKISQPETQCDQYQLRNGLYGVFLFSFLFTESCLIEP